MSVGRQITIVSDDDQIEERRNLVMLFPRDARPRIESTSIERFELESGRTKRSRIVVFLGSSPKVEAEASNLPVQFERHGARYHRRGEIFVLTAKTPALVRQKDLRALQNELTTLEDGLFGVAAGFSVDPRGNWLWLERILDVIEELEKELPHVQRRIEYQNLQYVLLLHTLHQSGHLPELRALRTISPKEPFVAWPGSDNLEKRSDYQPGDHLVSPRHFKGLHVYDHHGIYVGDGQVIHYSGKAGGLTDVNGKVERVGLNAFSDGQEVRVKPHLERMYTPAQAVERAESLLSENDYNSIKNNCEHLVVWCIQGKHASDQIDSRRRLLGSIIRAGRIMLDPIGELMRNL